MSLTILSLIFSISFPSLTAFSYFCLSLSCFNPAVSANQTYFLFCVRKSIQLANHIESLSCMILPQSPSGIFASFPKFSVTSFGVTLGFHLPLSGCSPLPMNIPGGSAI